MKSILEGRPDLKREIYKVAEVAGYLWEKGWAERNGGNITVNVTEYMTEEDRKRPAIAGPYALGVTREHLRGCYFYCKGTGMRMRDLAREPMANGSIIRICDDCSSYEIIADEHVTPTSELPSHLAIHNYLIGEGYAYKAIVHTHPIELVAMSHTEEFKDSKHLTKVLWSMIPETLAFAPLGLGFIPYGMPSSLALADATLEGIKDYDVVLWEKHGTVAVGRDVMDAFDQTDVLNKAACIYMRARTMGFIPEGMTDEQMKEIQDTFHFPRVRVK